MKICAAKQFISTVYGNIASGQVLVVSDAHGRHFIENKLAVEIKEKSVVGENFTPPAANPEPETEAQETQENSKPENTASSQAGQASAPKIVKKLGAGKAQKRK